MQNVHRIPFATTLVLAIRIFPTQTCAEVPIEYRVNPLLKVPNIESQCSREDYEFSKQTCL
eukprot:4303300-Amphidinium_carterae.1